MNDKQRQLARHALGLPNERKRSHRNRYYAAVGTATQAMWTAMVGAGEAASARPARGLQMFGLTLEGAKVALDPGETLCPEDFPA